MAVNRNQDNGVAVTVLVPNPRNRLQILLNLCPLLEPSVKIGAAQLELRNLMLGQLPIQ
jgi:hypothetical protein